MSVLPWDICQEPKNFLRSRGFKLDPNLFISGLKTSLLKLFAEWLVPLDVLYMYEYRSGTGTISSKSWVQVCNGTLRLERSVLGGVISCPLSEPHFVPNSLDLETCCTCWLTCKVLCSNPMSSHLTARASPILSPWRIRRWKIISDGCPRTSNRM